MADGLRRKVHTQGVIWATNSLYQWGVELGKAMASAIFDEVTPGTPPELAHDGSTNALIRPCRNGWGRR